jgi:hypothetical protein
MTTWMTLQRERIVYRNNGYHQEENKNRDPRASKTTYKLPSKTMRLGSWGLKN